MVALLEEVEGINIDAMDAEINESLKANVTLAISTELLKKLVSKVENAISKKTVQDIYKFIYLEITSDKLTLRGINNDYLAEAFAVQNADQSNFKITAGTPASICFPGDKFIPIVKKLLHKETSIMISSDYAVIKSGRPKFELHGMDGSQFPSPPSLGEANAMISIHPDVLSTMYDRTIYAASSKESRPMLTGVHHKISGNMLKCVATDSHRLGQFVYELEEEYADLSTTVPTTALSEVKKHLAATTLEVNVHFHDSQVVYEFENTKLYARVLEGNYPDTSRLIFDSSQSGGNLVLNVGSFRTLLGNSTVYNPDQPIILRLKPEYNQLRLNTREPEVGEFQEDLATTHGDGEDVILAVNVRYLQEALSKYGADDYFKLEFMPKKEGKPAGMQPFKGYLHNGNPECVELFVPVRSNQISYTDEVVIDDFQGAAEFEFNAFNADFDGIE